MFPRLILASVSPRRRQILAWTGLQFEIQPADIDESSFPGEAPQNYVLRLAESKARAAGSNQADGCLVLAADTIVCDGSQLLGKPSDADHARQMLQRLRGRCHQVVTALAIFDPAGARLRKDLCASDVCMRAYSDAEMESYIAGGDPLDKAGSYAIQHEEFRPVTGFNGCFASVMGLPLCHLRRSFKEFGLPITVDIPRVCQQNLGYHCPIHTAVMRGEMIG